MAPDPGAAPRYGPSERSNWPDECPLKALLRLNVQGMMFLSRQLFDAGTRLGIKVDLKTIRCDLGVPKSSACLAGDLLLRVEGIIAECHTVGDHLYQVTFLFDRIRETDRLILRSLEQETHAATGLAVTPPPVDTPSRPRFGLN